MPNERQQNATSATNCKKGSTSSSSPSSCFTAAVAAVGHKSSADAAAAAAGTHHPFAFAPTSGFDETNDRVDSCLRHVESHLRRILGQHISRVYLLELGRE